MAAIPKPQPDTATVPRRNLRRSGRIALIEIRSLVLVRLRIDLVNGTPYDLEPLTKPLSRYHTGLFDPSQEGAERGG